MVGILSQIVTKRIIWNVLLKRKPFDYHTKLCFYNYNIDYTTIFI